ncbi:hypothetical protein EGJ58_17105 [Brucella anthropi]|nr:hypothetical protein EGJ58_17105 [Brucella anthropi]
MGLICKRDWEEEYRALGPVLGRRSEPDVFLITRPAGLLNQQACIADMHFQQIQMKTASQRMNALRRHISPESPQSKKIEELTHSFDENK